MFPERVESLRGFVLCECRDIPPDLVLSIIRHESAGIIGRPGKGHIRSPGIVFDVNGVPHDIDVALGLMQTIPATIQGYNSDVPADERATLEDMTGTDERAARLQIRVGCRFLAGCNQYLHKKFPDACPAQSLSTATDDQIGIVLTAYAVGPGNTAKKLQKLIELGKKPTFSNLQIEFPTWGQNSDGRWINRPLLYAQTVLKWYRDNKKNSYHIGKCGALAERMKSISPQATGIGFALLLAGAGFAINWYFTKRKRAA